MKAEPAALAKTIGRWLRQAKRSWRDVARTARDNRLFKLLMGFVAAVLVTIAATVVVFEIGTKAVVKSFDEFIVLNEIDENVEDLLHRIARLRLSAHALRISHESEILAQWNDERAVIEAGIAELRGLPLRPATVEAVNHAADGLAKYEAAFQNYLEQHVHPRGPALFAAAEKALQNVSQELAAIETAAQGGIDASANAFSRDHRAIARTMMLAIMILLAAAAIVGGALLWRMLNLVREAELSSRTKGEFLSMMGQELRTPLNGVIGMSDMMQREAFGPLAERYKSYASLVHRSARQLQIFLDDVLELVHTGPDAPPGTESVSLVALVEESLKLLAPLRAKHQVEVRIAVGNDVTVAADSTMLRRIAIAIIGNAIKFTPDGGRVSIDAERRGDRIALVVADNGVGINPQFLARVTDPYFRIDRGHARKKDKGGMGLAMVKRLVDLNKGTLAIESEPGKGTTVHIVLPSADPMPLAA